MATVDKDFMRQNHSDFTRRNDRVILRVGDNEYPIPANVLFCGEVTQAKRIFPGLSPDILARGDMTKNKRSRFKK